MDPILDSLLSDPARKSALVEDCVALVESEVASKSGIRGRFVKAGYAGMKKIQPGIVAKAVRKLMPEFAPALAPHVQAATENSDLPTYFNTHAKAIAESLLAVTDARAKKAERGVLTKIYSGLRSSAAEHTAAAMPGLGKVLERHVG